MTELKLPAAVWDARDDAWFDGPFQARSDWLRDQGLPVHKLYRIEFYAEPGDVVAARICCYALNEEGRRHWTPGHVPGPHDHDQCDAAREPPRTVLLDALPPEELR